jgi:YVTN family beta-propeller protein
LRPWTLPDGKTLLVGSSYNNWWYVIDALTGEVKDRIKTPDSPLSHNMAVTPDGKTALLSSLTTRLSAALPMSPRAKCCAPFRFQMPFA